MKKLLLLIPFLLYSEEFDRYINIVSEDSLSKQNNIYVSKPNKEHIKQIKNNINNNYKSAPLIIDNNIISKPIEYQSIVLYKKDFLKSIVSLNDFSLEKTNQYDFLLKVNIKSFKVKNNIVFISLNKNIKSCRFEINDNSLKYIQCNKKEIKIYLQDIQENYQIKMNENSLFIEKLYSDEPI